jgi:serine protease Do
MFLVFVSLSTMSVQAGSLPDFAGLVEKYGDAVVNISTVQKRSQVNHPRLQGRFDPDQIPDLFRHFFDQFPMPNQESQSLGSGLIISDDGYIITNHHVVKNAQEVVVRLVDRRELVAEIIGSDEPTDIALLKVSDKGLPAVKLGQSDSLRVGEWVFAIGSPYGFDHSVTAGIVSAKGRSLPNDNYVPFIQTDVAINPGNSGGPLFNLKGEVIGINSQIYSRTGGFMGLSFAIPISIALEVVDQLKEHGHVNRGWLGVVIQEVNRDLAESFGLDKPHGALVAQVVADSPAEKAGVKAGDIIVEFNGFTLDLASDLPPIVGRVSPGSEAKMVVIREKREKSLKVKVGKLPDSGSSERSRSKQSSPDKASRLGLSVSDLTAQQREDAGVSSGVVVTSVSQGPGLDADIRPGDVITMLNYKPVDSVRLFEKLVNDLPTGKSVPMQIHRRGKPLFVPIRID